MEEVQDTRTWHNLMPGSKGKPLIGYTLDFLHNPLSLYQQLESDLGDTFWIQVFGTKFVTLLGADANKLGFMDRDGVFSNEQGWGFFIGEIFTRGLLLRDGDDHRAHRRIMSHAFKKPAMEKYLENMNPMIAQVINQWPCDRPFKLYPKIKDLLLDIAAQVFLGLELGPQAQKINAAFIDTVNASTAAIRIPIPGLAYYRGLKGRQYLTRFFRELLPQKRTSNGSDMLSQLCRAETEAGETFSDQEIIDHILLLLMAAHDTTTSALTSMLYVLGKYPEWQQKVRDESRALSKLYLTHEDLAQLHSADLVIKEALRLYPPLAVIPRKALQDFEWQGYRIPAGSLISLVPVHTHMSPRYWTAPETFDPLRFSPERAEHKRHSHCWLPFGGGAHMCLGLHFADMQLKSMLHQLVLRYQWQVPEHYTMPVEFVPITRPKDGLPITLQQL